MTPPDVYPEGIPFYDARVPADDGDRLQDDTSLQSVPGGFLTPPGALYPNGQNPQPGGLAPLQLVSRPLPFDVNLRDRNDQPISGWHGDTIITDTVTTAAAIGVPPLPGTSVVLEASVTADDITFLTGKVYAPSNIFTLNQSALDGPDVLG
jgi:hypothetical protein